MKFHSMSIQNPSIVFLLKNHPVEEEKFRQDLIEGHVGVSESYVVMGNIKFVGFAVLYDDTLRKRLIHYDENGEAYFIVDAFGKDAWVYTVWGDNFCVVTNVIFVESASPPA